MTRQIQLNLALTPVVNYDGRLSRYSIYYEEFPEAIATGKNEDEAENNLIFLVEDMWSKRPEDLKSYLLKNFIDKIHINKLASC